MPVSTANAIAMFVMNGNYAIIDVRLRDVNVFGYELVPIVTVAEITSVIRNGLVATRDGIGDVSGETIEFKVNFYAIVVLACSQERERREDMINDIAKSASAFEYFLGTIARVAPHNVVVTWGVGFAGHGETITVSISHHES